MKLDAARLCLDCEEVHEDQVCPICSSEAFAYLTRWVQPASEARVGARTGATVAPPLTSQHQPRTPEQIEAYRQLIEGRPKPGIGGVVAKGVLGIAAVSLAGWAWRANARRKDAPGPAVQPETPSGTDPA